MRQSHFVTRVERQNESGCEAMVYAHSRISVPLSLCKSAPALTIYLLSYLEYGVSKQLSRCGNQFCPYDRDRCATVFGTTMTSSTPSISSDAGPTGQSAGQQPSFAGSGSGSAGSGDGGSNAAGTGAAGSSTAAADAKRVTTRTLARMRQAGRRITMLTAYDFPTAAILDAAGIDMLLVGDSLAMVVQGHETTLPVTLDQMIYHAEMVARAAKRAMVIVDLPFPEGQVSIDRSIESAARILKETRSHGIKLEGGAEQAERIKAMTTAGIPVMAHVGLRPQNVHVDGGYVVQRDQEKLIHDAVVAEQAGAFAVLIECVPTAIAQQITDAVAVPTIGIGAGAGTSGQVLVVNDLIGLTSGYLPRFVTQLANVKQAIGDAAAAYRDAVKDGSFPSSQHGF
jgi:3-methyl-2-oxobutanoate hydroxymethyltransferase